MSRTVNGLPAGSTSNGSAARLRTLAVALVVIATAFLITVSISDADTQDKAYAGGVITYHPQADGEGDYSVAVNGKYVLPENWFVPPAGEGGFTGWSVKMGGTESVTKMPGDVIAVTGDVSICPIWDPLIRLSLEAGDGSGTMEDMLFANGSIVFPNNGFTAPSNKYFTGWTYNENLYRPGETLSLDHDATVKATWSAAPTVHTLTFSAGEGSGTMDAIRLTSDMNKYTLPECGFMAPPGTPEKYFSHWSVSGSTDKYSPWANINVTSDLTITAIWDTAEKVVQIKYLKNGTYDDAAKTPVNAVTGEERTVTIGKGVNYWLPDCEYEPEQVITGTTIAFKCWDLEITKADGTVDTGTVDKHPTDYIDTSTHQSILIKHRYQESTNSVTYELDEGHNLLYTVGWQYKLPSVPYTKPGYAFNGWQCTYGSTVEIKKPGEIIVSKKTDHRQIVVKPLWVLDKTTITIDETPFDTMTDYVLPNYQTTDDQAFDGWSINGSAKHYQPGQTISTSFGTVVTVTPVTHGYSSHTDRTITVFNSATPAIHVANGSDYLLTALPQQGMNEFKNWSVKKGSETMEMYPGQVLTVDEDVTLTANWIGKKVTITFQDGSHEHIVRINAGNYTLPAPMFEPASGKIFGGWVIGSETKSEGSGIEVAADTTATAVWIDGSAHTISFTPDEGSGSMPSVSIASTHYILPNCGFNHPAGKSFGSWKVGGVDKDPGEVIELSSDIIVTAQWSAGGKTVAIGATHGDDSNKVHDSEGNTASDVEIKTYYGIKSTEYNPEYWSGTGEVPSTVPDWIGPAVPETMTSTFDITLYIYMKKAANEFCKISVPNDSNHTSRINSITYNGKTKTPDVQDRTITDDNRTVVLDLSGEFFTLMNNKDGNVITVTLNVTTSTTYHKVFGGWLTGSGHLILPGDVVDYGTTDLYAKWVTPDVFIPSRDIIDLRVFNNLDYSKGYTLDLITPYANLTIQYDQNGTYKDGKLETIRMNYTGASAEAGQHFGNYASIIPGDGRTEPDMFGTIYNFARERTHYSNSNTGIYWMNVSQSTGDYLNVLPAGTYRSVDPEEDVRISFSGSGRADLDGDVIFDSVTITASGSNSAHGDGGDSSLFANGHRLIMGARISNADKAGSGTASNIGPQLFGGAYNSSLTDAVVSGKKMIFSNDDTMDLLFYPNGGSDEMDAVRTGQASKYVLPDCGFTAPTGKAFAGWLVEGKVLYPGSQITVKSDLTVWATWGDTPCTIHIDGKTIKMASGSKYVLPSYTGASDGFSGWSVGSDTKLPGDIIDISADLDVTPVLSGSTSSSVSFDAGGGIGTMGPLKVSPGTAVILPNSGFTAPSGKVFAGWDLSGVQYNPGDLVTVQSDMQFTAMWEDIEELSVDLATFVIVHSGIYYNIVAGSFGSNSDYIGTNQPLSTYLVLKGGMTTDTVAGGSSGGRGYINGHIGGKEGYMDGGTFVYLVGHQMSADDYEEKRSGWYTKLPGRSLYFAEESTILEGGSSKGSNHNQPSEISGSTHVFISGTSSVWDVQAAGRTGTTTVDNTYLEIGGRAVVRHTACGTITDGSSYSLATADNTYVFVGGDSTVASVFGAGYDTCFRPTGKSMIEGTVNVTVLDGTVGNVFGGGYRGSIGDGNLVINVNVLGGEIGNVYGGGSGGLDKIEHTADGDMLEPVNNRGYDWSMGRSIVNGDIHVTVGGDAKISGNVYGGGMSVPRLVSYNDFNSFQTESGLKEGNTDVEVAAVVGNVYVNIVGSPTINGSVYGGGKGVEVEYADGKYTFVDKTVMEVVGYSSEEGIHMTTIPWYVNAKGEYEYEYDTTMCNSGTGTGFVENSRYLNSAKVHGNTTVTVDMDGGIIHGSVYGGSAYGKVTKNTVVDVKKITLEGDVFGGGYGREGIISVYGDRVVYLEGEYSEENTAESVHGISIQGSVYGGSFTGVDGSHTGDDTDPTMTDKISMVVVSQGRVKGAVFGGGLMGKTYGDTYVYIGYNLPSLSLRAPVVSVYPDDGKVNILTGSVFAGGNISTGEDAEVADAYTDYLVMGKGTVRVHGNANNSIGIEGSIMASGNACLTKGETLIELSNFYNARVLSGIHRADTLIMDNTVLKVEGRSPLTPIAGQVKLCSIYGIGKMIMRNGASVAIDQPIDNVGELHSMSASGGYTTVSSPENRIVFSSGPTVYIREVDNESITYGKVYGHLMMVVTNQQSYGAYAVGSITSSGGFVITSDGSFREADVSDSQDVRCWFVSGIEKKVLVMDLNVDSTEDTMFTTSSHVQITKFQPDSGLVYTGGMFNRMATDSNNDPYEFVAPNSMLSGTDLGFAIGFNHGGATDLYDPTKRDIYLVDSNGDVVPNPSCTYFTNSLTDVQGQSLISQKMRTASSESPTNGLYNIWFQMSGHPENMTAYLGYLTLNFQEVRKISYEVERTPGVYESVEKDLVSTTIEVRIDMYIKGTNAFQNEYFIDLRTDVDTTHDAMSGTANAMLPRHGQLTPLYFTGVEPVRKEGNAFVHDEGVTISGTFFMVAEKNFDNTNGWANMAPRVLYDLSKSPEENFPKLEDGYVGTMLGNIAANASQGVINMVCTKDGVSYYPILKVSVLVVVGDKSYPAYVYLTVSPKAEYTVTFYDMNTPETVKIKENELLTRDLCPTPSEDNFNGWYLDDQYINRYDYNLRVTNNDLVLYARYMFEVTFDNMNGTKSTLYVAQEDQGARLNSDSVPAPVNTGYDFGGWYKDNQFIFKWDFVNERIVEDTHLYAKWIGREVRVNFWYHDDDGYLRLFEGGEYTVVFATNGNDTPNPVTKDAGEGIDLPQMPSGGKWYLLSGAEASVTTDNRYIVNANDAISEYRIVLRYGQAIDVANGYHVVVETKYGPVPAPAFKSAGASVTLPELTTDNQYVHFVGWKVLTGTGEKTIFPGNTYTVSANDATDKAIIIKAIWEETKFDLSRGYMMERVRGIYPSVNYGNIFETVDPWHGSKNILDYAEDAINFKAAFVKWNVISPYDAKTQISVYQDTKMTTKIISIPDVDKDGLWEYYLAHDGGYPRYGDGPDMLEINLLAETTSVAIKVIMDIDDKDEEFRSTIHISDPKEFLVYPNGPIVEEDGRLYYFDEYGNRYTPVKVGNTVAYYLNESEDTRYYFDRSKNCWTCIYESEATSSTTIGNMYQFIYQLNNATRNGYELLGWHNQYVSLDNALNPSPELLRTVYVKTDENGHISTARLVTKDSENNDVEIPLMVGDYTVSAKDADADGNIIIVGTDTRQEASSYTVVIKNGDSTDTRASQAVGTSIALVEPTPVSGKLFVGWKVKSTYISGGSYTVSAEDSDANDEILIRAVWKDDIKYTITFKDEKNNRASNLPSPITGVSEGETIGLIKLVASSYTFLGWKVKSGLIEGNTYTVNGIDSYVSKNDSTSYEIILTGVWVNDYHNNYDIKFVSEYGERLNDITNKSSNNNVTLPTPSDNTHRFIGWYVSTGDNQRMIEGKSYSLVITDANEVRDIIMVAQWEDTYIINGGTTRYQVGDIYNLDYSTNTYYRMSGDYYSKGGSLMSGENVFTMKYLARWHQIGYNVHVSQPSNGSVDGFLSPRTDNAGETESYITDWDQIFQYGDKILLTYTPKDNTTAFVRWIVTGQYYIDDETSASTFLVVQGDCTISVSESTGRVIDIMIAYDDKNLNGKSEKEHVEVYLHDRSTGLYKQASLLPAVGTMEHYNAKVPYSDDYEVVVRYHNTVGGEEIDEWYPLAGTIKVTHTGETTFAYDVISARFVLSIYQTGEETNRQIINYDGSTIVALTGHEVSKVDGNTNFEIVDNILIKNSDGDILAKIDKYVGILRSELGRMRAQGISIINNADGNGPPPVSAAISPNYRYTMFEGYPYSEDPSAESPIKDKFIVATPNYRVDGDSNISPGMSFYLNWVRTDSPADVVFQLDKVQTAKTVNVSFQKDSVQFDSITYNLPSDTSGTYEIPIVLFDDYDISQTTDDPNVSVSEGKLVITLGENITYKSPVTVSYTKKTVAYQFEKNIAGYTEINYGMEDGSGKVGDTLNLPTSFSSHQDDSVPIVGWMIHRTVGGDTEVDKAHSAITYTLTVSDIGGIKFVPLFNQMTLNFVTSTKAFENGSQKITVVTNKGGTVGEYWVDESFKQVKWLMTEYNSGPYVCTGFLCGDIQFADNVDTVLNKNEYTFIAQWTVTDTKTFRYVMETNPHGTVTVLKDAVISHALKPGTSHVLPTDTEITLYIQPDIGYMVDVERTRGEYDLGEPTELPDGRGYVWMFLLKQDVNITVYLKEISFTITFVVNGKALPHDSEHGVSTVASKSAGGNEYYGLSIPKYRVVAFDYLNGNPNTLWYTDLYQTEYGISKKADTLYLEQSMFVGVREYQFYATDNLTLYALVDDIKVVYHDYEDTEDGKEMHDVTPSGTTIDLPAPTDQGRYEMDGYVFAGWAVLDGEKRTYTYYPQQTITIDLATQNIINLYAYYLSGQSITKVYDGQKTTLELGSDDPKGKQTDIGDKLKVQYSETELTEFSKATDPVVKDEKDAGEYSSYYAARLLDAYTVVGQSTLKILKVDAYVIAPSRSVEEPTTISVSNDDIITIGLVGSDVNSVSLSTSDGYGTSISAIGKVHTHAVIDWNNSEISEESAAKNYNITYIDGTLAIYPKDSTKHVHEGYR